MTNPVFLDRVSETTTTTGTGTITLAGAKTGFRSFSQSITDGDFTDGGTVAFVETDGASWEVWLGVYTLTGTTLSKATLLRSSSGGTPVTWGAGSKDVFVDFPAAFVAPPGLKIKPQSANYTTTALDFFVPTTLLHPTADTTARTLTIDSQANVPLTAGASLVIINEHGAGVITIAVTTQTLRWVSGGVTGSRTLAADSSCVLIWMGDEWQISGSAGLT